MTRAGADPGSASTSSEIVDLVGHSFGPDLSEPVRQVAVLSDRALFSSRSAPDAETARQGWVAAVGFGRQLRSRLPLTQRVRGSLKVGGPRRRP
jgi:hypothetical protein